MRGRIQVVRIGAIAVALVPDTPERVEAGHWGAHVTRCGKGAPVRVFVRALGGTLVIQHIEADRLASIGG